MKHEITVALSHMVDGVHSFLTELGVIDVTRVPENRLHVTMTKVQEEAFKARYQACDPQVVTDYCEVEDKEADKGLISPKVLGDNNMGQIMDMGRVQQDRAARGR